MNFSLITTLVTAPQEGQGWIGRWAPGIGDRSALGWVIVVAYFVAAALCLLAFRRTRGARGPRRLWLALGLGLVALGFNKQLDLQTALTELARIVARRQGWFEQRRTVQVAFIVGLLLVAAWVFRLVLVAGRGATREARLALAGAVCLVAFIVMRASSFHHVDTLLGLGGATVTMNGIVELAGITWVAVGAALAVRRSGVTQVRT